MVEHKIENPRNKERVRFLQKDKVGRKRSLRELIYVNIRMNEQ